MIRILKLFKFHVFMYRDDSMILLFFNNAFSVFVRLMGNIGNITKYLK